MQATEHGIVIAIVADLEDPEGLGRVKVRYPYLDDRESDWARLITLMAGAGRGTLFRPEVDDEVAVIFELGDERRPYILGGLWSSVDPHPPDDGKPVENNWRLIRSRSGHVLRFDDTRGAERVEIIDKDETHKVIVDTSGDKIQILCDSGDVEIKAAGKVDVKAETVNVEATGEMSLKAGGTLTLQGKIVNIN